MPAGSAMPATLVGARVAACERIAPSTGRATCGVGGVAAGSDHSSSGARGSARSRGTSGVARRTDEGRTRRRRLRDERNVVGDRRAEQRQFDQAIRRGSRLVASARMSLNRWSAAAASRRRSGRDRRAAAGRCRCPATADPAWAPAEPSENSYPQLRQRSTCSYPRYPHLGHFIG